MLKSTLRLKEVLIYISKITENDEFKNISFSSMEWYIIQQLINIFEIFVILSIYLQGELYTILLLTLLYIYQIYDKLEDLIDNFEN